jgi:hypothetical protein
MLHPRERSGHEDLPEKLALQAQDEALDDGDRALLSDSAEARPDAVLLAPRSVFVLKLRAAIADEVARRAASLPDRALEQRADLGGRGFLLGIPEGSRDRRTPSSDTARALTARAQYGRADARHGLRQIAHHQLRLDPHDAIPRPRKARIPPPIRATLALVHGAIDFDDEANGGSEQIHDAPALRQRHLAPKAHPERPRPKRPKERVFRRRRRSAHRGSASPQKLGPR